MITFLVGNGPTHNVSDIVDKSDCVIRMNKAPTFNKGTGTRTDVLVLVNTGTPGKQLLSRPSTKRNPAFKEASEIRLPITPQHAEARLRAHPNRADQLTEWSPLTVHPSFDGKTVTFVPEHIVAGLEKKLGSPMPSTGMIIIEQLIETRSPGDVVYICGFGHSGWNGHPWAKEKALIESYIEQGFVIRA